MEEQSKEKCSEITTRKTRCKYDATIMGLCRKHYNIKHGVNQNKKEEKFSVPDTSSIPNRDNGLCKVYVRGNDKEVKQCGYEATHEGLCTFHHNRKDIPKKEAISKVDDKKRCIELNLRKGERCKNPKKMGQEICATHYRMKMEKEGKTVHTLEHKGETRECSILAHSGRGSPYPREAVPIENFYLKNDPEKIGTTCVHCREYESRLYEEKLKKYKEERESEKKSESDFRTCHSSYHNIGGVSTYPKDQVPKENFLVEKKKGVFEESLNCSDCRSFNNNYRVKKHESRREQAAKEGKCYCRMCCKIKNDFQMGVLINGERSKYCKICQIKMLRTRREACRKLKRVYRDIQREKIEEIGCSCNNCKKIILKPDSGSYSVTKLDTFVEDDIRYVSYKDEIMSTRDFIEKHGDLLEFRVLDLDHLNAHEQLERGIINSIDDYIKKKGEVSGMSCEKNMRDEAKITQILCVECHLRVGLARSHRHFKPDEAKEKLVIEAKKQGCSCCGWYDEKLLRYLEFDHIDPSLKIAGVGSMMKENIYTIEELAEEIVKCRILCRSCHRIRTWYQVQEKVKLRQLKYEQEELVYLQENDIRIQPIYGDEIFDYIQNEEFDEDGEVLDGIEGDDFNFEDEEEFVEGEEFLEGEIE